MTTTLIHHTDTPIMSPALENAIREEIPKLPGWTTPERGLEAARLVLEHKPAVFVEIGTFAGRASLPIALAMREVGSGKAYTIDPWRKEPCLENERQDNCEWWAAVDFNDIHRQFMECLWRLGLDDWLIPIRCASHQCHQLWDRIDFLLIDGCHSESASSRDADLYLPKVPPGGLILCDDLRWVDEAGRITTEKARKAIEAIADPVCGTEDYGIWMVRHHDKPVA